MVTMGVDLPGATLEDGWPTQAAIDAESHAPHAGCGAGAQTGRRHARFDWGEAWARFDPKGFMASSGIRYRPRR